MNKYLLLYRGPAQEHHPSAEEMQQIFARWTAWKDKYKQQILDLGDGLKAIGGKVLQDGKVTDGPLPEAKEIIGGYSVVQAESMEQAIQVARECPMAFQPETAIEIREMMGY